MGLLMELKWATLVAHYSQMIQGIWSDLRSVSIAMTKIMHKHRNTRVQSHIQLFLAQAYSTSL